MVVMTDVVVPVAVMVVVAVGSVTGSVHVLLSDLYALTKSPCVVVLVISDETPVTDDCAV